MEIEILNNGLTNQLNLNCSMQSCTGGEQCYGVLIMDGLNYNSDVLLAQKKLFFTELTGTPSSCLLPVFPHLPTIRHY